ncbi:hypothetical protein AVEN_115215-1 [Araneus ventricosus]|uniref:Uncharacterized protein n=1 Tax=Araneus ventricosus TaxID=182803 RepID=A0A4Y1ZXP9_ARAVE|nr:hypothetical protein AVEN_115215-1 [Araneus ventricosus]
MAPAGLNPALGCHEFDATSLLQVRRVVTSSLLKTCFKLAVNLQSCRVKLAAILQTFRARLLQTKIAVWEDSAHATFWPNAKITAYFFLVALWCLKRKEHFKMSSPSHTSEYSYLGPLSTSTLYGHNEDWQWSPEDQYNHYTYLTSSSTSQEPLDYSIGSSMFFSGEENVDSSSYKGKPMNSDSGYPMDSNERMEERPADEQVFETLGQTVKHDPYQYEDYDDIPPQPKKRGRKKKEPNGISYEYINTPDGVKCVKQERITETFKQRKRMDRFDGMPEEEVMKKSLPDHLSHGLDIVIAAKSSICGIVPPIKGAILDLAARRDSLTEPSSSNLKNSTAA